jgi:hypothetical protein
MFIIHDYGVWLAVALELVTFAEILAFGDQVFHLAFGKVCSDH